MSANGVYERLAALDQAVASLQVQQGGSEALQPNYLTITPTGLVVAQFSGVFAGSVILPEGPALPADTNLVAWSDDGTYSTPVRGYVTSSSRIAGTHEMEFQSSADGGVSSTDHAYVTATSTQTGAAGSANVAAGANDNSGAGASVSIIDSAGRSNYPQLQGSLRQQLVGQPARAYRNAAFSLTAGTAVVVPIDTQSYDDGAHLVLASHEYKCPVAGYYSVTGQTQATSTAAGQTLFTFIYQNSAAVSNGGSSVAEASAETLRAVASDTLKCAANDTIQLGAVGSAALALVVGTAAGNFLTVQQVG